MKRDVVLFERVLIHYWGVHFFFLFESFFLSFDSYALVYMHLHELGIREILFFFSVNGVKESRRQDKGNVMVNSKRERERTRECVCWQREKKKKWKKKVSTCNRCMWSFSLSFGPHSFSNCYFVFVVYVWVSVFSGWKDRSSFLLVCLPWIASLLLLPCFFSSSSKK